MRARLTQPLVPDLFAPAATTRAVHNAQVVVPRLSVETGALPSPPRHLLPKDLPAALAWLDDGEFDLLLAAVIDEAQRRDRKPSRFPLKSEAAGQHNRDASKSGALKISAALQPRPKATDNNEPALPRGQMNAVRAAFKAGVKPSMIARQFGISQSDVRKAIASDVRQNKF
jgi:hypothetical protein